MVVFVTIKNEVDLIKKTVARVVTLWELIPVTIETRVVIRSA